MNKILLAFALSLSCAAYAVEPVYSDNPATCLSDSQNYKTVVASGLMCAYVPRTSDYLPNTASIYADDYRDRCGHPLSEPDDQAVRSRISEIRYENRDQDGLNAYCADFYQKIEGVIQAHHARDAQREQWQQEQIAIAQRPATTAYIEPAQVDEQPSVTSVAKVKVVHVYHHAANDQSYGDDEYYTNVSGHHVHRPVHANSRPAGATAHCADGSWSFSEHHRGTCSHHGGVSEW